MQGRALSWPSIVHIGESMFRSYRSVSLTSSVARGFVVTDARAYDREPK
jgi:hypothetical protein